MMPLPYQLDGQVPCPTPLQELDLWRKDRQGKTLDLLDYTVWWRILQHFYYIELNREVFLLHSVDKKVGLWHANKH